MLHLRTSGSQATRIYKIDMNSSYWTEVAFIQQTSTASPENSWAERTSDRFTASRATNFQIAAQGPQRGI